MTICFGNWSVFIWIDDEWYWKWKVPSTANDEKYHSHTFYLGYLNFDITWMSPETEEA